VFVSDMMPPIVRVQAQRALCARGCTAADEFAGRPSMTASQVASHGTDEFFSQGCCFLRNLNHGPGSNAVGIEAFNRLIFGGETK
jgi:hypothetical protein